MGKFTITDIPIIVMIGQSNEGGHNDDAINATVTTTTNGFIFYKPDWTSTNNGTWQSPIATGVNNAQYTRIPTYDDIGMELKLADLLYTYTSVKHYFIKLTYGGAEITQTVGEDDLNPDSGEYWTIAMDYTLKNAIEQVARKGKVRIKAVTFHQGEGEAAISEAVANAYYQTSVTINASNPLPYFFQELRDYHPLLNGKKVYITKVYTTAGGYPYISNVATRQTAYVNEIGNSELLSMDNDVVFADAGVHWNAATQELKATNIYNLIKDN